MVLEILAAIIGVPLLSFFLSSIHQIETGHVGVYWRGGRLLEEVAEPGFHVKYPWDRVADVQVTMQTDSVTEIPCGTSGGVMITFGGIEVVNRLPMGRVIKTMSDYGENYDKMWIFDKIHHEINQFCSSHTLREVVIDLFDTLDESLQKALQESCDKHDTGIEIIAVRVTKPRIPSAIRDNYERLESEHQSQLRQAQEAQALASRRRIEIQTEIEQREGEARMAKIADDMHLNREKAHTDAAHYKDMKNAEANMGRLTPEFLQYTLLQAIANNTKIFFGDKLPSIVSGDFISAAAGHVGHQQVQGK